MLKSEYEGQLNKHLQESQSVMTGKLKDNSKAKCKEPFRIELERNLLNRSVKNLLKPRYKGYLQSTYNGQLKIEIQRTCLNIIGKEVVISKFKGHSNIEI